MPLSRSKRKYRLQSPDILLTPTPNPSVIRATEGEQRGRRRLQRIRFDRLEECAVRWLACIAFVWAPRNVLQTYLCFRTLSNPFLNCVTSGVTPDSMPPCSITRQRKLLVGPCCASQKVSRSSEGRLVTRMMISASKGWYTIVSLPHFWMAFCTSPIILDNLWHTRVRWFASFWRRIRTCISTSRRRIRRG